MRYPSDLTDGEWALLAPLLPTEGGPGRPRTHERRLVLDAAFYVLRSGCAWRLLPAPYPPDGRLPLPPLARAGGVARYATAAGISHRRGDHAARDERPGADGRAPRRPARCRAVDCHTPSQLDFGHFAGGELMT